MIDKEFNTVVWEVAPKAEQSEVAYVSSMPTNRERRLKAKIQYSRPIGPAQQFQYLKPISPEFPPPKKLDPEEVNSLFRFDDPDQVTKVFRTIYADASVQPHEDDFMFATAIYLAKFFPGDENIRTAVSASFTFWFK